MGVMRKGLLAGLAAIALTAAPAAAANTTVGCAGLQGALSAAKAGDVITLNELCKSGFPYKLPALAITLAGTPGAGFDGGSTVQLEGSGAAPTIEGLIFQNAHSTALQSGGALSLNNAPNGSTVTLARDTFTNDVASGGEDEGGGARLNTTSAAVTVRDSTFSANSATRAGGALALSAYSASLSGDTFSSNSATGVGSSGGALSAFSLGGPLALSSSRFTSNSATAEGGGALLTAEAAGIAIALNGNTFSHNSVSDPGGTNTNPRGYLGGGLSLQGISTASTNAVQQGNTFDGNSVSFKAAAVSSMGGGESMTHVALQSTGDRFTNNTLQPPNAKENAKPERVFGWGAGLSVAECGETTEPPPTIPNVESTLTNSIVAGNTLQSGPSASGAGIYIGFVCPNAYSTLRVSDSTITANTVSGASGPVAGISGGPHDVLSLANTILYGDSGGPELGGFNGLAGVNAASSDVCADASPFLGSANICADPKLVGGGDVHETAASPTLEAGSNTLVPSGLTSDVFGGARIVGRITCAGTVATVDIGAAEFNSYATPICPPLVISLRTQPTAPKLTGLRQSAKRWREGKRLAQLSASTRKGKRRLPVGTTFSFKLDQAARVTFTFTKTAGGRKVGKRCVAQSRRNRHKRHCRRTIVAGALSYAAKAGTNKLRFQGLISRRKTLKPGSYTLLLSATASSKRSRTATLRFTIVR
ncbi:MAG: hypothetical protein ACYDHT_00385 [Solirubrobacteraceae bacterium]